VRMFETSENNPVRNGAGKVVMECVIETKAIIILQFIEREFKPGFL
jgi:hypothetical protein